MHAKGASGGSLRSLGNALNLFYPIEKSLSVNPRGAFYDFFSFHLELPMRDVIR